MKAQYINHYLSDTDIANFARQSFTRREVQFTDEQNNNLIRYLARGMRSNDYKSFIETFKGSLDNKEIEEGLLLFKNTPIHWVPFGHPQITLGVSAPIPVKVQLFKHKIGMVESEESRRYISSRPEFFIPEHFRASAEDVKQGSGGIHPKSNVWKDEYVTTLNYCINKYLEMIQDNVCPEQARFILPQGVEANWVWTGSLYAFANFYKQRIRGDVQKETQMLAKEIGDIIDPLFPMAWKALTQN